MSHDKISGITFALVDGATVAVDFSKGNIATLSTSSSRTFAAPTNVSAGQTYVIQITNSGTGTITTTFNTAYNVADAGATKFTAPGQITSYIFFADASGNLHEQFSVPYKWYYDLRWFGALATASDNITAVQRAVNALPNTTTSSGGDILAVDLYKIASPVSCGGVAPPGAPTAALAGAGAGNVDNGTHLWKITYGTANGGETEGGTASGSVNVVDKTTNGKVALSSIPVSVSSNVTSRNVYRTKAGTTTPYYLSGTISDNTTTTYTDNVADSSLTTQLVSANTTGITNINWRGVGSAQGASNSSLGTGLWYTGSTPSNSVEGNPAVIDAVGVKAMTFQDFCVRGPASSTWSSGYLIDMSYGTSCSTNNVLLSAAGVAGLTGFVAVKGGAGGNISFNNTQFAGKAGDAGTRYAVDNTDNTMNSVRLENCLLTSARGVHNPGNAWRLKSVIGEVLNAEGTLALVTCDTSLTNSSGVEIDTCTGVDITAAGDGAWLVLGGGTYTVIGGNFQCSSGVSLYKAIDTVGAISDAGVSIFATGGTNHVLNTNSKTVTNYFSRGAKLTSASSSIGTHITGGNPQHFDYEDITTGIPVRSFTDTGTSAAAMGMSAATYQSFDRRFVTSAATALGDGTLQMYAINLPAKFTITNVLWMTGTTAQVLGATPHYWTAVFDSSRALLRQVTDNTAKALAANTLVTDALSSTFTTTYSGLHYIGIMVASNVGAGGTQPTAAALVGAATAMAQNPKVSGTADTGLAGTAPNPAAAITATTGQVWVGVS